MWLRIQKHVLTGGKQQKKLEKKYVVYFTVTEAEDFISFAQTPIYVDKKLNCFWAQSVCKQWWVMGSRQYLKVKNNNEKPKYSISLQPW